MDVLRRWNTVQTEVFSENEMHNNGRAVGSLFPFPNKLTVPHILSPPTLLTFASPTTSTSLPLLLLARLIHLPPLPPVHQPRQPLPEPVLHPQRPAAQLPADEPPDPGEHDVVGPPRQHGAHNRLGDGVRLERVVDAGVAVLEALEQRRARVALADGDGAHAGRLVQRRQLGAQALVEGERGGLGGGVVDHARRGDVRGDRGDGDDHAVVGGHHGRQELPREVVVRERVDGEGQAQVGGRGAEEGLAARDAGVVDEDGGGAERSADGGASRGDGGFGGEVALEESRGWGHCAGRRRGGGSQPPVVCGGWRKG